MSEKKIQHLRDVANREEIRRAAVKRLADLARNEQSEEKHTPLSKFIRGQGGK